MAAFLGEGMRVLLTGADGFAGRWTRRLVIERLPRATLFASGRDGSLAVDIADADAVDRLIADTRPTHVLNLAAMTSAEACERAPARAFAVNATGPLNLAVALRRHARDARLIHVSASAVYGAAFEAGAPITELSPPEPRGVHAASKYAGEIAARALAGKGLRVLILRPFDHTGPGQAPVFPLPAMAERIARAEIETRPAVIRAGRLDVVRDLCDVRDIARAYLAALVEIDGLPNAVALNLCSGVGRSDEEILRLLLDAAVVPLRWESDAELARPTELPWAVGDGARALRLLEWRPGIPIKTTLRDLLAEARRRLADARRSPAAEESDG